MSNNTISDSFQNICLKSAVRHVLKDASEDYKKENKFQVQNLLKLRCLFGSAFERALELYEGKKITCFTVELTRSVNAHTTSTCFYEVKGQSSEVYTIFPNINFCTCLAFENQVLIENHTFTCKHVLAAWLASVNSDDLNIQTIPESKYCEILLGRVMC